MNKPKYYNDIEQGTDAWLQARLGIPTASEVKKLLTAGHTIANNKASRAYAMIKAAERISNRIERNPESWDMARGTMQEPIARGYYHENYAPVTECGFITREFDGFIIGASPDGLVGEDGMIEIKSRIAKYQIETMISDSVPDEYMVQIQTSLLVSGRDWCDFVQYSNGMPLFVKRVYPDPILQDTIIGACQKFEIDVCEMVESYNKNAKRFFQTEYIDLDFEDEMIV